MKFWSKRSYLWLLILLMVLGSFWLKRPFENVKIFATYNYLDQKELQAMVERNLRGDFWRVRNLYYLRNQLLQNVWIEAVSIKRQWPAGLVIRITEHQPILSWNNQLINNKGELFTPDRDFVLDLPVVESDHFDVNNFLEIYTTVSNLNWPFKLVKIKNVINHYWQLEFAPRFVIILKIKQPAKTLLKIYPLLKKITVNFTKIPQKVDARYTNDLAVKW